MTNCGIEQSSVLDSLPLLPNLTKLILKNNSLQEFNFNFAPKLSHLDLSGNYFKFINLMNCDNITRVIVGSSVVRLSLPQTDTLILETPPIETLEPEFAKWIQLLQENPLLNTHPKITFRVTELAAEDHHWDNPPASTPTPEVTQAGSRKRPRASSH